jgi:hypothetical protein
VPWYRVRLRLSPTSPPTAEQLERAGVDVWRRGNELSVTVAVDGGDPTGAIIRAQNTILDLVPGEVRRGEFELTDPPQRRLRGTRRRPPKPATARRRRNAEVTSATL